MCPPGFTKIGNECYFLSPTKASWLDSHFECKDKNGKLAEPLKSSDRQLRKYLLERGRTRGEIWIGKPTPSINHRMSDNLPTFRTNNSRWHVQLAEDEVAVGLQRKGHEVSVVQPDEAWVISDQLSISLSASLMSASFLQGQRGPQVQLRRSQSRLKVQVTVLEAKFRPAFDSALSLPRSRARLPTRERETKLISFS